MNKQKLIDTLVQSEKQNGLLAVLKEYFCPNIRVSIGYTSKACTTAIDELSFSVRSRKKPGNRNRHRTGCVHGLTFLNR